MSSSPQGNVDRQLLRVELAKLDMTMVELAKRIGCPVISIYSGLREPGNWRMRHKIERALGVPIFSSYLDFSAAARVSERLGFDVLFERTLRVRKSAARYGHPEFLKSDGRPVFEQLRTIIRALDSALANKCDQSPATRRARPEALSVAAPATSS